LTPLPLAGDAADPQAPPQVQPLPQEQLLPQVQVEAPAVAQGQLFASFSVFVMIRSSSKSGVLSG